MSCLPSIAKGGEFLVPGPVVHLNKEFVKENANEGGQRDTCYRTVVIAHAHGLESLDLLSTGARDGRAAGSMSYGHGRDKQRT